MQSLRRRRRGTAGPKPTRWSPLPGWRSASSRPIARPVLLSDNAAGVVGAAHAGWRGASRAYSRTPWRQWCRLGAHPASIIAAAIGPTIAQASYEVDGNFRTRFAPEDDHRFASRPGVRGIGSSICPAMSPSACARPGRPDRRPCPDTFARKPTASIRSAERPILAPDTGGRQIA